MKEDTKWRLRDSEGKEYIIIDSEKVDLQEELNKTIVKQMEEIERLNNELKSLKKLNNANYQSFIEANNIINKLEKYLIEEISRLENVEQTPTIILITGKVEDILDELRNLKGDESDENII